MNQIFKASYKINLDDEDKYIFFNGLLGLILNTENEQATLILYKTVLNYEIDEKNGVFKCYQTFEDVEKTFYIMPNNLNMPFYLFNVKPSNLIFISTKYYNGQFLEHLENKDSKNIFKYFKEKRKTKILSSPIF